MWGRDACVLWCLCLQGPTVWPVWLYRAQGSTGGERPWRICSRQFNGLTMRTVLITPRNSFVHHTNMHAYDTILCGCGASTVPILQRFTVNSEWTEPQRRNRMRAHSQASPAASMPSANKITDITAVAPKNSRDPLPAQHTSVLAPRIRHGNACPAHARRPAPAGDNFQGPPMHRHRYIKRLHCQARERNLGNAPLSSQLSHSI